MRSILRGSILLFSLVRAAVVSAQGFTSTSTLSSETSSTSSAPAQTWTITVGKGDHKFRPDVTQASVGDIIEFQFFPPNHSVVRAEYGYPCVPYEKTGIGKVGFFAGFHPVDAILEEPPSWTIRINDTDPIFFYCSAPGSCIKYGMVGVINPNATTSLAKQRQEAENSAYMLQPGEDFPDEGGPSSSSSVSSASPTTHYESTSTPTSTPTTVAVATPTQTPEPAKKSGLSAGAIAGIAVGGAAVLIIVIALFYLLGRNKSLRQMTRRTGTTPAPYPLPGPYPPPGPDMRSSTMTSYPSGVSGYPPPPGPEVPPYTSIAPGHDGRPSNIRYSDAPSYPPKPSTHANVEEMYPPTPGSDAGRWSNLDAYGGPTSPPLRTASPSYSQVGSINQNRLAQNASPGVNDQLPSGQMNPKRAPGPHELATQTEERMSTQGYTQDIKYQ